MHMQLYPQLEHCIVCYCCGLVYSTFLSFVLKTDYKKLTCKNLYLMAPGKINYDLIEAIIAWIVDGVHDFPAEGSILVSTCSYCEKSLSLFVCRVTSAFV